MTYEESPVIKRPHHPAYNESLAINADTYIIL